MPKTKITRAKRSSKANGCDAGDAAWLRKPASEDAGRFRFYSRHGRPAAPTDELSVARVAPVAAGAPATDSPPSTPVDFAAFLRDLADLLDDGDAESAVARRAVGAASRAWKVFHGHGVPSVPTLRRERAEVLLDSALARWRADPERLTLATMAHAIFDGEQRFAGALGFRLADVPEGRWLLALEQLSAGTRVGPGRPVRGAKRKSSRDEIVLALLFGPPDVTRPLGANAKAVRKARLRTRAR